MPQSRWKKFKARCERVWTPEKLAWFYALVQGSLVWQIARGEFDVGGSSAGDWMGINKYQPFHTFLAERLGVYDPHHPAAYQDTKLKTERDDVYFKPGHEWEPLCRYLCGLRVQETFLETGITVDNRWPHFGASLDGITADKTKIAEFKFRVHGKIYDDIPTTYMAQMQFQMLVSGATKCYFACLKYDELTDTVIQRLWHVDRSRAYIENYMLPLIQLGLDAAERQDIHFKHPKLNAPYIHIYGAETKTWSGAEVEALLTAAAAAEAA